MSNQPASPNSSNPYVQVPLHVDVDRIGDTYNSGNIGDFSEVQQGNRHSGMCKFPKQFYRVIGRRVKNATESHCFEKEHRPDQRNHTALKQDLSPPYPGLEPESIFESTSEMSGGGNPNGKADSANESYRERDKSYYQEGTVFEMSEGVKHWNKKIFVVLYQRLDSPYVGCVTIEPQRDMNKRDEDTIAKLWMPVMSKRGGVINCQNPSKTQEAVVVDLAPERDIPEDSWVNLNIDPFQVPPDYDVKNIGTMARRYINQLKGKLDER